MELRYPPPPREKMHFRPAAILLGSGSSRECLDAPAILATFTAGRTGWLLHVHDVITILMIMQTIHTLFA